MSKFFTFFTTYLLIIISHSLYSQAGILDASFGTGGLVTTDIGGTENDATSVVIQSDGKILLAGYAYTGPNTHFAVARYTTDGILDNTFGTGGIVLVDFAPPDNYGRCMALQADGKIVVAGESWIGSSFDIAVVRLNVDGTIDDTFGTSGKTTIDISSDDDNCAAIVIQGDDKILLAGFGYYGISYDFILARLETNGTLDVTFDGDGMVNTDFGGSDDMCHAIALQPDGKIILAGESGISVAIARYNTDGSADASFGTAGKILTSPGGVYDAAHSICIINDGGILVAGNGSTAGNFDFEVLKFDSIGNFDNSFGVSGILFIDYFGSNDEARWIKSLPDGKILVVGFADSPPNNSDFAMARLNSNGSLDAGFGTLGLVHTNFGTYTDFALSAAIQDDGKIVLAGYSDSTDSASDDFAMARYSGCSAYFELSPSAEPHVWYGLNLAEGVEPLNYLWDWDDGSTSTEEYPVHYYADSGFYNICLSITDASSCSSIYCDSSNYINRMDASSSMLTVNIVPELPTNIYFNMADKINIQPNPFSQIITVNNCEPGANISIFDITGKLILIEKATTSLMHINTSSMQNGNYIIRYTDNSISVCFKILKAG